ncbi:hypothetical protein [Ferruginivarius sediminum]|uniref:Uncharacterized protein n=1 Tax=Ferruginivarius sediminum TaxID=2661937 RepID=A0A369TIN0_9PROT|nr:hypothetical protein [Ferruginivarius sediminum]RDD62736.1 hypothetical protein DRB17_06145 [Ferruginivarius sediminum]
MTTLTDKAATAIRLDLGEQHGRLRFAELLSGLHPGTRVTVVIGGEPGRGRAALPASAASYASAMREVEASVYDAV